MPTPSRPAVRDRDLTAMQRFLDDDALWVGPTLFRAALQSA